MSLQLKEIPKKAEQYTLFIKRTHGSIYGVVTLQRFYNNTVTKIFDKLPMASGQYPFVKGGPQDWIKSKSPTPCGEYWISTKKEILYMEPRGTRCYIISDVQGGRTITSPDKKVVRDLIMLHLENRNPGTIGCTALLHDTPERARMANLLFDELDRLYVAGIDYIKVKVFF